MRSDKVLDVLDAVGVEYYLYNKVLPDPPEYKVDEAVALRDEEDCDIVIAVGGGSSMDLAKAVNLMEYNAGPILRFADPSVEQNRAPGLIAVPTTSGTGSEVSVGLVITDSNTHIKYPITSFASVPEYAVMDPELMAGMPPHLTASTGFDTFAHAVEAYTTTFSNIYMEPFCEKAIELVAKWLPVAVKDGSNLTARGHMAVACSLASMAMCAVGLHCGHSIAHAIGGQWDIPHGNACSYAIPHAVEFIAPEMPARVQRVGEIMGATFTGNEAPEEIGKITKDALIRFRDEEVGVSPISKFNIDMSKFDEVVRQIKVDYFQFLNPRTMTEADAVRILREIIGA